MNDFSAPPTLIPVKPLPLRLHWFWVLFLGIITLGIFTRLWMIVQASWAKKINGSGNATPLAWLSLILGVSVLYLTLFTRFAAPAADLSGTDLLLRDLVKLGNAALYLTAAFSLRRELEDATGLVLQGGMTFFFGPIYFQYHLRKYGRVSR